MILVYILFACILLSILFAFIKIFKNFLNVKDIFGYTLCIMCFITFTAYTIFLQIMLSCYLI